MRWQMITISKLKTILSPVVSVYEHHITTNTQVQLPYAILIEMDSDNVFADNQTYQEIMPLQIILVEAKRNDTLEANIKNALTTNNIPFNTQSPIWDKDEEIYLITFDING